MVAFEELDAPRHVAIEPSILYFGTPVVLVATLNEDGTPNLAPMSSAWALGNTVVLGLGSSGQTAANLRRLGECTLNLPDAALWPAVERLAPLTGRDPVPEAKAGLFRFERDKFGAAGLTAQPSETVAPPRVRECPLQLEGTVIAMSQLRSGSAQNVEVAVTRVHAAREIVVAGTNHIDVSGYRPLLYFFRHYFAAGDELGKTFRVET